MTSKTRIQVTPALVSDFMIKVLSLNLPIPSLYSHPVLPTTYVLAEIVARNEAEKEVWELLTFDVLVWSSAS